MDKLDTFRIDTNWRISGQFKYRAEGEGDIYVHYLCQPARELG